MQEKKAEKITLKSLDVRLRDLDMSLKNLGTELAARIEALEASLRRMGILLEEMSGKLSLLFEGYMGHDTRIVGLEERMEKAEGRADVLP